MHSADFAKKIPGRVAWKLIRYSFVFRVKKIARSRAEILIATCERYKEKNNKYPGKLSDLVPDFIKKIPVAKYTLTSNKFFYITSQDSHLLFYVTMPPFGRPTYSFEKQKWAYID